ncbi:MAG TPA: hypothetical protein VFJ76_08675 [Solirubrobacterales bacterium]|nr:hypothetical protein [Solirubrobacterales bacterium]
MTWTEVAVPLVAAAIGASSGAFVSRHLKRQELYAQAAQKINEYLDEAADALNELGQEEFDAEETSRAKRAVNLAVFHSTRLESPEATERLRVADFVLWDMLEFGDRKGRLWAYQAIDDAMRAVVQFMILPRFWPPRIAPRKIPPNRFPNTVKQYRDLTTPDQNGDELNWKPLREWVRGRERELSLEQRRS